MSAAYPSYPFTPEALRLRDTREPEHCRARRRVVEAGGEPVGAGGYSQRGDMYAPGRFFVLVYVAPEFQALGIGKRLFDTALAALEPLEARELRSFCSESDARTLRFLAERGFTETMRDGQASLELSTFAPSLWPVSPPEGIRVVSYAALSTRPDFAEALCALHNTLMACIPPLGVRSPVSVDDFVRGFLDPDQTHFSGSFAAVDENSGELVGCSELRRGPDGASDTAWVGLTGVRRAWRGRGVALALKLSAMHWAREQGFQKIVTGNASDNVPILKLNEKLGFVRSPWRVQVTRFLQPE
jgi:GNAT superfamily N-acetyltransferase